MFESVSRDDTLTEDARHGMGHAATNEGAEAEGPQAPPDPTGIDDMPDKPEVEAEARRNDIEPEAGEAQNRQLRDRSGGGI